MASRTVLRHLAVGVALVVALAACSSASAPTPTTTPSPTLTVAPAITAVPTPVPTSAPTVTPMPDLIMTTGSATITVTNVGVATVKNVAPLATAYSDPQVITPDGVLDLTWGVYTPGSGGADVTSELHLTFKPDPSGTTHISANGARVTIGTTSLPVRATMYVTSDQYIFDTTADGGGHPAQADCTVTSTRSASGGVSGTVTCAGTFFIPAVRAHRSFKANATFWAEPAGGVGPSG